MNHRIVPSHDLEVIGQFAGEFAHEFNNLLAVILNHTHFASESLSDDHPGREAMTQVTVAAKRAAALTRQLMVFSKHPPLREEIVSVSDVIDGMLASIENALGDQIELRTTLTAEVWPVAIDVGQLRQAILDLIVNARDAMPQGGTLSIAVSNVRLDDADVGRHPGARPGDHACVVITDSGDGMDDATAVRAFGPFFSTRPKPERMGLGLAVVHGIVTRARGSIALDSELGVGTSATMHLPAAQGETVPIETLGEAPAKRGSGETILVVDDEQALRTSTCRILARHGYNAVGAATPADALEICRSTAGRIDALLTDMLMPTMSGAELADAVVEMRPEVKVIFMSGYPGALGATRTVALDKPFAESDLLAVIRRTLDEA